MSKMNKKLPALFLTLVLVLGMTACGGKTTDGTTGSTDNTVTAEEEDHKTQNTKVDPNSPITEEMLRNHAVAPAEDFTYDVEDDGIKIRSYMRTHEILPLLLYLFISCSCPEYSVAGHGLFLTAEY